MSKIIATYGYALDINDFYNEYINSSKTWDGTKEQFITKYKDSKVFSNWISKILYLPDSCEFDFDHSNFVFELDILLRKTKFKNYFLEILNGGWRGLHGISNLSKLTAKDVLNKSIGTMDASLVFKKEGRQISITRYSHDEPTGATILLRGEKDYNNVYNEIYS